MKKIVLLSTLFWFGLLNAQQQTKELRAVIYFAVNEDIPLPEDYNRLFEDLKGAKVVSIYGHADTTANTQYNQKLSERRANNVAALLKKNGITLKGTDIKGYGETQPVGSGLITDRRVIITYEKPGLAQEKVTTAPQPSLTSQVSSAKKGDKLKLKNMNFENNSDIMLPSSTPVLNELLKIMKENPRLKIEIQGHICCQADDVTHVSDRRAFMVYTFLSLKGIEKDRLSYRGFGSTKPIYALPEKNEEERIANRRVEIEIIEN